MTESTPDSLIGEIVDAFRGKECWYVSSGGAVGPAFALAFGKKIRRRTKLENKAHSKDYQQYEGEANLYIWCTWRLDSVDRPLTGSDDSEKRIGRELARLVGKKMVDVRIDRPGWDLHIRFDDELTLHVFCDHVGDDPSFDGNWEAWLKEKAIFFGPGSRYEVQAKD